MADLLAILRVVTYPLASFYRVLPYRVQLPWQPHNLRMVADCLSAIPAPWLLAAQACGSSPPYQAFAEVALGALGWQVGQAWVAVGTLTVRAATTLQLGNARARVDMRARNFVREAYSAAGSPPMSPSAEAPALVRRLFDSVWRLRCGNVPKEVLWRLYHNAFPTAARRHAASEACACGAAQRGRVHHFWHCPVAQGVLGVLQRQLASHCSQRPGTGPAPTLAMAHVWMAVVPPNCGVLPWAWRLVCVMAVAAMEYGRAALSAQGQQGTQAVVPTKRRVVARFWDLLTEACALGMLPAGDTQHVTQPCLVKVPGSTRWRPSVAE